MEATYPYDIETCDRQEMPMKLSTNESAVMSELDQSQSATTVTCAGPEGHHVSPGVCWVTLTGAGVAAKLTGDTTAVENYIRGKLHS